MSEPRALERIVADLTRAIRDRTTASRAGAQALVDYHAAEDIAAEAAHREQALQVELLQRIQDDARLGQP